MMEHKVVAIPALGLSIEVQGSDRLVNFDELTLSRNTFRNPSSKTEMHC